MPSPSLIKVKAAAEPSAHGPPLPGETFDFAWEGKRKGQPQRGWLGRVWVPEEVREHPERPVPVLVFLHGLNKALIPYRWMGGGYEGDVRRIVSTLITSGRLLPMIVAAPSDVDPAMRTAGASWPSFDVDHFLALTRDALRGHGRIDMKHVVLAGHSGAGCDDRSGLALAKGAATKLEAILSIDTCMGRGLAESLALARPETTVVVTYQDQSWETRPFAQFRLAFERAAAKSGAPSERRRIQYLEPQGPGAHDALVRMTLNAELPKLFAPTNSQ